jgi:hypothetical protein
LQANADVRGAGRIGERRELDENILAYYEMGREEGRLPGAATGRLEYLRTRELLSRHLPPAPATVLDVGRGGLLGVLDRPSTTARRAGGRGI